MGPKPKRYQHQHCLHFITFSCYRRMPLLDRAAARETFERELERVRRWYGCYISGYVVMPEHVHLLISEPERSQTFGRDSDAEADHVAQVEVSRNFPLVAGSLLRFSGVE
jgi:hypothetical protein